MAAWNPRANEIFLKMLECSSSEESRALLDSACGGDVELRQAVEALLAAHADAGSLLEGSPTPALGEGVLAGSASEREGELVAGRYKLLQPIGEGGMGTVWMAEQTEPVRRKVALKVIKTGMGGPQVIARFEAERQALALMDHPHIARVFDAGSTADGRPFFVMELVKGAPITAFCDERRLNPRQRLELFLPVCKAVQHAHTKGVIHRDLKPSNVLVALYDSVPAAKVIDFGIAKATGQQLTEQTLFTGFGAIVGTLEYMSPEQAELNQLDVDTRSDVYSLGVLLYVLLTGSTPLDGQRLKDGALLEVLRLIREDEPPPPSTRLSTSAALASLSSQRQMEPARLTKAMRGEIDWIVMKALEKDRSRRYETASGLAQDIEHYLRDEPVQAGPPTVAYRVGKFVRRNRGPVLLAALLFLALLGGVAGTTFGMLHAVRAERRATAALETVKKIALDERTARAAAEESDRSARVEALRADTARHALQMDAAYRAWERHDLVEATRLLEQAPVSFQKTWEYRYVRGLCHRRALPLLRESTSIIHGVAFSPDGTLIATVDSSRIARVHDATTGAVLWTASDVAPNLVWSGDSRRLASGDCGTLRVWEAATGQVVNSFETEPTIYRMALTLNSDGSQLAFGTVQEIDQDAKVSQAWLGDVETGQQQRLLPERKELAGVINAISPDLQRLVTITREGAIIHNLQSGSIQCRIPGEGFWHASLSPDGERIVICTTTAAAVWNAETGELLVSLNVRFHNPSTVRFSHDGASFLIADYTNRVWIFDAVTGLEKPFLRANAWGFVHSAALGPDGTRLVVGEGDQGAFVWNIASVQEGIYSLPYNHNIDASTVVFSTDSERFFSHVSGNVQPWAAASGQSGKSIEVGPSIPLLRLSADASTMAWCEKTRDTGSSAIEDFNLFVAPVEQGHLPVLLLHHPGRLYSCAISPDNRSIAACVEKEILICDINGRKRQVIPVPTTMSGLGPITFSPDSRLIAISYLLDSGGGIVSVWDMDTGIQIAASPEHKAFPHQVSFFPDGRRIVSMDAMETMRVWDVRTGQNEFTLPRVAPGSAHLVLSPDGKRLVMNNRIWDTATWQQVFVFRQNVQPVAFSPNGRLLLQTQSFPDEGRSLIRMVEAP